MTCHEQVVTALLGTVISQDDLGRVMFHQVSRSSLRGRGIQWWQSRLQSQCQMEKSSPVAVVQLTPWREKEMRRKEANERDTAKIRRLEQHLEVLEGALICWQQWYRLHTSKVGHGVAEEERRHPAQVQTRRPAARERGERECVCVCVCASVINYSRRNGLECSSDDQEHGDETEFGDENACNSYWGLEGEEQEGKNEENEEEEKN